MCESRDGCTGLPVAIILVLMVSAAVKQQGTLIMTVVINLRGDSSFQTFRRPSLIEFLGQWGIV